MFDVNQNKPLWFYNHSIKFIVFYFVFVLVILRRELGDNFLLQSITNFNDLL